MNLGNSKSSYSGFFTPRDGGAGYLVISDDDTSLEIINNRKVQEQKGFDFHGCLEDGRKASFLECIVQRQTLSSNLKSHCFPHYIAIGQYFIGSNDEVIQSISYTFENASGLVSGFKKFGVISPSPDEFQEILQKHETNFQENLPRIGHRPVLLYFTGNEDIVRCDSDIGDITIANISPEENQIFKEITVKNKIVVTLEFAKPKTVSDALQDISTLHAFFELCLGGRQRYLSIRATLEVRSDSEESRPPTCQIYWTNCNKRVSETRNIRADESLIEITSRKEEFTKMMKGWVGGDPKMIALRRTFVNSSRSDRFLEDKFIGAANLFENLPETCFPDLKNLGLMSRILRRADMIKRIDSQMFSEIDMPCRKAVIFRNHFVHGNDAPFDYARHVDEILFLIDTLEFVFIASDLLDLGWNYSSLKIEGASVNHDLKLYISHYKENLKKLKSLLSL